MKTHQTTISKLLRPGWAAIGAALALVLTVISADAQQIPGVNVYPAVPGLPGSTNYSVRVCAVTNPSVWTNAFTFQTSVPANPDPNFVYYSGLFGWTHSYVNFEMSAPVTVEITSLTGSITNAAVHPARKAGNVYCSGGKAYFTLNNPCNVAVDINGQMDSRYTGATYSGPPLNTISIHANPFLAGKPATNDPSVYLVTPGTKPPQTGSWTTLYFLPGVHTLGTDFQLYSGKNYYIPGDAMLYASFNNDNNGDPGNNIRIFGHGTISGAQFYHYSHVTNADVRAIALNSSGTVRNVRVEGITVANPGNQSLNIASWAPDASTTNVVSWVKVFTWRPNGDGGGCGANNDVNNVFYRTQDDGLYVGGREVRDNVLWVDVNGLPFRLSGLPNYTDGTTLTIYNNDVIYDRTTWWSHGNAMALADGGDHGSGIIFSNFVVSDPFPDGPAIAIMPGTNNVFSGTRFANVTVATPINSAGGLNYLGASAGGSSIHDLTFDNLVIGGVLVTPGNWLNYFATSGNVYNIFFTCSGTTPPDALPRTGWVASASLNSGSAANAIDGNIATGWTTGADQANGQWFQVDMQMAQTFNRIVMDAGAGTNNYPRGYQVTVSNDGTNWSSAVATGSGSNAVITITFASQTARYLRVALTGSAPGISWSIQEFYVYPPAIVLLPRTGWVASASGSGGGSPANAIDGNTGTRWSPGVNQANGQYFQVDLGSAQTFSQIGLDAGSSASDYPRGYKVYVSNDGISWGSGPVATGSGSSALTTINFAPQTARYIKVIQTGSSSGNWWSIYEFNVYSTIPTTYTLTQNSSNGTVALNPAWSTYPAGAVVNVTATPSAGYVFNGWSGDLSGSANPATITMSTNRSITASMVASSLTYTLTAATTNCTVTFNPPGPTYPVNTVVTVTANPNAGYVFSGWGGALSGSANPTTITMNANNSITASATLVVLPRTGWVASASLSSGSASSAIDGNTGTRWTAGVNEAFGQWFQVDMGSAQTFNQIVLDAGNATDYPRGYQVKVSNDGSTWSSPVATGSGSGEFTTTTFAPQTARYVRVYQTGSDPYYWWSIAEFNVSPVLTYMPPTVALTVPANGTSYGAPATVSLSAGVTPGSGSVTNVAFYAGTTLLANDGTSSYSNNWMNVAAGSYALTAVAQDNLGLSSTSAVVNITVTNVPPAVVLTAPANGTSYGAPATVSLSAGVTPGSGSVTNVAFYAGTTLLANDGTSPYSNNWMNVAAGSYVLTAVAMDNLGLASTSAVVNITVTCALTTIASNGSITLNPPGGVYNAGTVVVVTANPNSGYSFSGWSGALSGSTNPATITMDMNQSVTANFSVQSISFLPPVLQGGQLQLQWVGGGTLQTAPDMAGPWSDVPSAVSPYLTPATNPAQFFRVKQ